MIVLWGANIASQPKTARHIISARRRGAKVVTIDVRRTEAAAQSDEVLLIRPGSDAALALAVMNVIITERLYDPTFVEAYTNDAEAGIHSLVQMMNRFSNMYGCQNWHPAMICWGLGGFGVGLTGALKVNTKEDMA